MGTFVRVLGDSYGNTGNMKGSGFFPKFWVLVAGAPIIRQDYRIFGGNYRLSEMVEEVLLTRRRKWL